MSELSGASKNRNIAILTTYSDSALKMGQKDTHHQFLDLGMDAKATPE